jgi:hypothetical protein
MSVTATKEQLKEYGVSRRDAARLERALCTLADFEGPIKQALTAGGGTDLSLGDVCDALRRIVDGDTL